MTFDVDIPSNKAWLGFPVHLRLIKRKDILDLLDKRRREERDPLIGREAERRLLDYELADLEEATNRFMAEELKRARAAAGSRR